MDLEGEKLKMMMEADNISHPSEKALFDCIYKSLNISNEEVQQKKQAAEEYCRHASEFTAENGGKPWKYILLAHDKVERTSSFEYLIAVR